MFKGWQIPPYDNIYGFHYFMYNLTGYTYIKVRTAWLKLVHAIYHHIICTILIWHNFLCIYMTYHALTELDDLFFVLAMTGITTGCTMRICWMEYYKEQVLNLHEELNRRLEISDLASKKWADNMRSRTERRFKIITKAFYSILPGSLFVFLALPLFISDEKVLPYLFPVKNLPYPYYEIVYAVHVIAVNIFILNTVSYDMICLGLLIRITTNLRILAAGIRKLGAIYPQTNYSGTISGYSDFAEQDEETEFYFEDVDEENAEFLESLRNCRSYCRSGGHDPNLCRKTFQFLSEVVRQHQNIRRQISMMDKIFSFNIFIHFVAGTAIFCMSAAKIFSDHFDMVRDVRLVGLAIGGFVDAFLYCSFGSSFLQSEEDFRTSLYSLPWYTMDPKSRKLLIFILTRLQINKGVTVASICNVSLDVFLGILKFSHSFTALLSEF